jgi:hypothetical protein
MDEPRDDVGQLDDLELAAERSRVMTALAGLIDRYRELNREIAKREALRRTAPPGR